MMMHMMKAYRQFMLLYKVEHFRACATSAMRDADNGKKVMRRIEKETGAYVDVGGGSTEISLLHDGVLAESHSFNIGTLRLLAGAVTQEERNAMCSVLENYAREFPDTKIIGSGGNINRLFKLAKVKGDSRELPVESIRELHNILAPLSLEERKQKFKLKDDRADVIVPAAEIFMTVASTLDSDSIIVPNISLADSIVDGIYKEQKKGKS